MTQRTYPTRKGQTVTTPGSSLDLGDFVYDRVTAQWYRIDELMQSTRYTRAFRCTTQAGASRRINLDSAMVKAYRWERA